MDIEAALERLGKWRRKQAHRYIREGAARAMLKALKEIADDDPHGFTAYVFGYVEGIGYDQLFVHTPRSAAWRQEDGAYYQYVWCPGGRYDGMVDERTALRILA